MKDVLKGLGYFVLYVIGTVMIQMVSSGIIANVAMRTGKYKKEEIFSVVNNNLLGMTVISGLLMILLFMFIFFVRKKSIKAEWEWNCFDIKSAISICLVVFGISLLFSLLTKDVEFQNSILIYDSAKYYSNIFPGFGMILMIANLLIIAPISEKIVFRGVIYTRVEKTGKPIIAIAMSAILFGAIHFMAGGGVLVLGAMVMGVLFGFTFYKFRSLPLCILAHIVANLPDFILGQEIQYTKQIMVLTISVSVICILIGGLLLARCRKEGE